MVFYGYMFQNSIHIDGLYIIVFSTVLLGSTVWKTRDGTKKGTNLLDFFVTKHHDACNDISWFTL